MAVSEVESGDDRGEEQAGGGERRDHQKKDGVVEEGVKVGEDEEQSGEDESREDGEEAGVPDCFGVQADGGCGAEAEGKRSHEANRGEDAEGGKEKMAGVKEVGVHVRGLGSSGLQKTDPLGRTSKRW